MTVENVQTDGTAILVWFDDRRLFTRSNAKVEALVLVEQEEAKA